MIKYISKLNKKTYSKILFAFFLSLLFVFAGIMFTMSADASADEGYESQYCLRDEYYVGLSDQGDFGNCWAFASVRAMENFLAQTTGEHFEINEAYFSATRLVGLDGNNSPTEYGDILGAGGSLNDFYYAINSNGFVLDSDLTYDSFYYLNADNHREIVDLLGNGADQSLNVGFIDSTAKTANDVKRLLTTYKNAVLNITNWTLSQNNGRLELARGNAGGHSICILGWDDNYTALDGSKGALIILNSYGITDTNGRFQNDGIVYLPYSALPDSSSSPNVDVYAYSFSLDDDYVYITDSNANYQAKTANKYYENSSVSNVTLKDKNIFDSNDDVKITYTFPDLENLEYTFEFYRGTESVSDEFFVIKDGQNAYVRNKSQLESGSYKVKIDYSYDKGGHTQERSILKQIFMLDGLEFNTFSTYDAFNNGNNKELVSVLVNSESFAQDAIYVTDYSLSPRNEVEFFIRFSPYSNWTSYSLTDSAGRIVNENFATNHIFDSSSYRLVLSLRVSDLSSSQNTFLLNLANSKHQKTYKIIVKSPNSLGDQNLLTGMLYVNLDGGETNEDIPKLIQAKQGNEGNWTFIPSPQKEGYKFVRYEYLTQGGTWEKLPVFAQENRYFVTYKQILSAAADNYFTKDYKNDKYKNYCFVRAIYEKQDVIRLDGTGQNTFDFGKSISLSLGVAGENVVWSIDGQRLDGDKLDGLENGRYVIEADFTLNGEQIHASKSIYINRHVYTVKADKTAFVYNAQPQYPNITIDGLQKDVDYQVEMPADSTNSQKNKQITIKSLKNNLFFDKTSIFFDISRTPLNLKFKNIIIEQGDELPTKFEMNQKDCGYLDADIEPLQVKFDFSSVTDKLKVGEYQIDFSITNSPAVMKNYDCSQIEKPSLFIMEKNFDVDSITLATATTLKENLSSFKYGQNFVIFYDCNSGMIRDVEYVVTGKDFSQTFSAKQQYITQRLPVGEYTIAASGTLVNGQQLKAQTCTFTIEKLPIKVVFDDIEAQKGEELKNISYHIESEYLDAVTGIEIVPQVQDVDVNKAGEYEITAKVNGDTSNFDIQIVAGKYVVKDDSALTLTLIIVLISLIVLVGLALIVRIKVKKKRADK